MQEGLRVGHTGVIHEDLQATHLLHRVRKRGRYARAIEHVHAKGKGAVALLLEFHRDGLAQLDTPARQHHFDAMPRQSLSEMKPQPAEGPGDQRRLSL